MIRKVREYIIKNNLLKKGDRVTVALSGGADSVCLLLCLWALREAFALELKAVHVHHGLRGAEADCDAEFCRLLCQRLEIPFVLRRAAVREYADSQKLSLEEAGRILRYRILREEAAGNRIAVAHHRDDQAETLLFHLLRGTGIRGLTGMAPCREDIIRPLLGVSREQIEEYLRQCGQDYQIDSSNETDDFFRNRIRHFLMPMLEELNPRAAEHLCQLAEQAGEVDDFLEHTAQAWLKEKAMREERQIRLPLDELWRLNAAPGKRVLMLAMEELLGSRKDIGSVHINSLWELPERAVGSRISLPGGVTAERGYQELYLFQGEIDTDPQLPKLSMQIFSAEKGQKIPEKRYTKWFDYDRIKNTLQWRFRQEGDYLVLAGVGRKTVKAYMIDRKIPARERNRIPVLADGSHVLWIAGYRISEAYKISGETKRILQVTVGGNEDEG